MTAALLVTRTFLSVCGNNLTGATSSESFCLVSKKEIEKLAKLLVSHQMVKLGENRNITPEIVLSFLEPYIL